MNIAIIDDQLLLSQLLATNLEQNFASCQTQVFTNAQLFLKNDFSRWRPDLVIIDNILPVIGGLDMIEQTQHLVSTGCKFIVVSSSMDLGLVKSATRKGVLGYVEKSASLNELREAIVSVMKGKPYICQSLQEGLMAYMLADEPVVTHLSARENEVFQHLCAGRSPKEIADDMHVSLHTIRQHIKTVLRKFNLKRTTDLVVYAFKKGLVKSMA